MRSYDFVEAFWPQLRAEQIRGGLGCSLANDFADALDFTDSRQAKPLMVFDQPRDVRRDRGRARFYAAMIHLYDPRRRERFANQIFEMQHNVVMKRSLISL